MVETSTPAIQNVPDANLFAALAREKVMAIKPMDKVLEALGISQDQFALIEQHPYFKLVAETFAIEWESATSTNKRVALQAAAALEEALPRLAQRMMDAKEALPAVVQAAQFIGKLAGAGDEKAPSGSPGDKFKIIFNLGADTVKFDEKGTAVTLSASLQPSMVALPQSSGESQALPDQTNSTIDLSGFAPGKTERP